MGISQKEFVAFLCEYYEEYNGNERLGQAFCNKFNISDARLFYCGKEDFGQLVAEYIDEGGH